MIKVAESVSSGHPDKVADIVADSIVDAYLKLDKTAICGVKALVSRDLILISGEIGSEAKVDIEGTVRKALLDLGFDGKQEKFNAGKCKILAQYNNVNHELNHSRLKTIHEQGAADQCIVVGYACRETKLLLPAACVLSRALIDKLSSLRKDLPYLRLDAKSMIAIDSDIPRIESIVLSTEHEPGIEIEKLRSDLRELAISPVLNGLMDKKTKVYINPIGPFENAGPYAETGISGRKVVADAYGSSIPVGGGAFSGKDPSKCDRSAAYYARHIAKSIVDNNLASECKVTLAYAIGISQPISISLDVVGNTLPLHELNSLIDRHFDFSPASICSQLDLFNLSYENLTKRGHFGHSDLAWERTSATTI